MNTMPGSVFPASGGNGLGLTIIWLFLMLSASAAEAAEATDVSRAPWPVPVVGWSASDADVRANTPLALGIDTLGGMGNVPDMNVLHLVGSIDPKRGSPRSVYRLAGRQEPSALALGQPGKGAHENAVLQVGHGMAPLTGLDGRKLTMFIEFKLIGAMSSTGNPKCEEDGVLLSLGPDILVKIPGRGREGKTRRLPSLVVKERSTSGEISECIYTAAFNDELQLGQWYRLALSWNGDEAGEQRVGIALNGVSGMVASKGFKPPAPASLKPSAPLLVGGDRNWSNVPIHLGAFAVYNLVLLPVELQKLDRNALKRQGGSTLVAGRPSLPYELMETLNQVDAWEKPAASIAVEGVKGGMLRVALANSTFQGRSALRLRQPLALDTQVTSVNFWICQPPNGNGVFSLTPLFADGQGVEIDGPAQLFVSKHCMPPNARKSGLWFYRFVDVPAGARTFLGFAFKAEDSGHARTGDPTDVVYIKDIGLERIDYARTKLYYAVGNFRDNFRDTKYNAQGARALTGESGGSLEPFILLDNLVDQAKAGRPAMIDLRMEAFDTSDRRVWSGRLERVPAADVPDLFRKITVRVTQPGTYRIRGIASDSGSGAYFTTDWTKLVILKGAPQTLPAQAQSGLLEINSAKPFGRLEKTDPRQITFSFGDVAAAAQGGRLSLRYAVIPYDEWSPRTNAKREVAMTHTVEVGDATPITVAYEPKRSAELVVAELWRGDTCLAHEERPIGIANALDRAPAFTIADQVPTLNGLAGSGKVWKSVTIVNNPGDDHLENLRRNITEAKKLTPDLGMETDMARLMPMPGVYDWDALKPFLDVAYQHRCRFILYLNQKWPPEWAPVEWASDGSGQVHRAGTLYAYMVGKSVYATGRYGPEIIRQFNQQLARNFLNHPGLGGYYFENEHLDIQWEPHPSTRSYHESYRLGFVQFVQRRYGTVEKLNQAYGTSYASLQEVRLPDGNNQAEFNKKVMFVDFRLFQREEVERFVLRDQFDAARSEDPRRPIIVYGIGEESHAFLTRIAQGGGLIANGGVHSTIDTDASYESINAVPGLAYRMEPHDVTNYDPVPHGFDEMIFGMLATGGRGMHAHIFLHGWKTFSYDEAMKPGQRLGFDKLIAAQPLMEELRDAEKLHDPIGIMELRTQGAYEDGIWAFHHAAYAFSHFNPRTVAPGGSLAYLDGSQLIYVARNTIDAEQLAYLTAFVRKGGALLMEADSARLSLESPDAPGSNVLLQTLGVDLFADGKNLPGVAIPHDIHAVGDGRILVARGVPSAENWEAAMPAIVAWAGIDKRLANSSDRWMQMHVLQRGEVHYLATTHRGNNQGCARGPERWEGTVQFLKTLPGARYRVSEMMSGAVVGEFTPAELVSGFAAGVYEELQMKIFRIAPLR